MPRLAEATRAKRRAGILAAALTCFARAGYHATTMAEVAEAAEVSKGTPYLYFPSKEALFIALYGEWDCGLQSRITTEVGALSEEERNSPRRVLMAVAEAIGAHVVEHAETCRVLMEARTLAAYESRIAAVVEASAAQGRERLRDVFRAGVEAGEWPSGTDTEMAALMFTASLYGLMARWHLRPGSFSWEAAAKALVGPTVPTGAAAVRERRGNSHRGHPKDKYRAGAERRKT